eukprot:801208-Pyramimonas_sp.AAC.1
MPPRNSCPRPPPHLAHANALVCDAAVVVCTPVVALRSGCSAGTFRAEDVSMGTYLDFGDVLAGLW